MIFFFIYNIPKIQYNNYILTRNIYYQGGVGYHIVCSTIRVLVVCGFYLACLLLHLEMLIRCNSIDLSPLEKTKDTITNQQGGLTVIILLNHTIYL